ncbi:MAG: CoA-binding protein [Dehalococcoidia bacterium]|nr:CoA-binding protein [Dehalococcoidia bacterium]
MNVVQNLKLFFEPRSLAFIGASRKTAAKDGDTNPVETMLRDGYKGKIYPVNPNASEIMGLKSYPSIGDVPGEVDLVVISLPREGLIKAVTECVQKGIKAIILYSMGLDDGEDDEGKRIQAESIRIAREGGARIVGPNTFGVINAFNGLNTYWAPMYTEQTIPLGAVCQSGIFSYRSWPEPPAGRGRMVGKVLDLGNLGDIDYADVLEFYESDPQTELIFLHMERVKAGRRFLEVARRVSLKKPILALKVGRTPEGARVVASHTGALGGNDGVYDGAFRQSGIIRVKDVDELDDLIKTFLFLPLMKGKGVGIIGHVGGIKGMGTDAFISQGLEIPRLTPDTLTQMGKLFPSWIKPFNPLDTWPAGILHGYQESTEALINLMLSDINISGLLFVVWTVSQDEYKAWDATQIAVKAAARFPDKPICTWGYGPDASGWRASLEKNPGILYFNTPERAARALAALHQRWRFLRETQSI